MRARWLGAVLVSVFAAAPAAAGTLQGKVAVVEKDGRPAQDLGEAVVWVEGPKARVRASSATVNMKGKAFMPRVAVVAVGGSVEFPNLDSIFHNVFSVSGENSFDLQLYKKPKSASKLFEHPGIVRIYCNIHPQMSGFVLVRDNPFSGARGAATARWSFPTAGSWIVSCGTACTRSTRRRSSTTGARGSSRPSARTVAVPRRRCPSSPRTRSRPRGSSIPPTRSSRTHALRDPPGECRFETGACSDRRRTARCATATRSF